MAVSALKEVVGGLLADDPVIHADAGEKIVAEVLRDVDAGQAGGGDELCVTFIGDVGDDAFDVACDAVDGLHARGFDEPPIAVASGVGLDAGFEPGQVFALKGVDDESDTSDFFHGISRNSVGFQVFIASSCVEAR